MAFAPHGDGWQGFSGTDGTSTEIEGHKCLATIETIETLSFYLLGIQLRSSVRCASLRATNAIHPRYFLRLTRSRIALDEGVPGKVISANAHRGMTDRSAFRVPAARSWTRIPALLINARLLAGTFAVTDTLRSTSGRDSDELGQTRT